MFDKSFSHYITYGATDQRTIRELSDNFDGLIVPGTVAAFQHEGTGGFVLTLSATKSSVEYILDPRFPLFQQGLERQAKKSHRELASFLGMPDLVQLNAPSVNFFSDDVIKRIATKWAEFNVGYEKNAAGKFEKYEKRLNEKIISENKKAPKYVFPPYLIANSPSDEWFSISTKMYDETEAAINDRSECVRVIATENSRNLYDLVLSAEKKRIAVWVSDLHELKSDVSSLRDYLVSIKKCCDLDISMFAMYGGFFSVLASSFGLKGACHGVGFGEHRSWKELPSSGPPPARFYLPSVHRYVRKEQAEQLWRENPELVGCDCLLCSEKSPIELSYHELMIHSVYARSKEIRSWSGLSIEKAVEKLEEEKRKFLGEINNASFPQNQRSIFLDFTGHLDLWSAAIKEALKIIN